MSGQSGVRNERRRSPARRPRANIAPPPEQRRFKPQPARVYKRRRWGAFYLMLLLVLLFIRCCVPSEHDREMKARQEFFESLAPTASVEASESVDKSRPVEIIIPAIGVRANFSDGACRFHHGVLDPESSSEACIFTAENKPYQLPGSAAEDIVVVAGQADGDGLAVFSKLWSDSAGQAGVSLNDALYLRTEASGDKWLKYQATDFHSAEEEGLSQSADIWGAGPMPGRLLTISAIQPEGAGAGSGSGQVRNAVVGWQFTGVVPAEAVRE